MKLWVWAKNDQPNQPQKMDGLVPEITSYVPAIYKSSFIHMYIYTIYNLNLITFYILYPFISCQFIPVVPHKAVAEIQK
jgi:hypothetical protein